VCEQEADRLCTTVQSLEIPNAVLGLWAHSERSNRMNSFTKVIHAKASAFSEILPGYLPDLSFNIFWKGGTLAIHLGLKVRNFFSENDELVLIQKTITICIGCSKIIGQHFHEVCHLAAICLLLVSSGLGELAHSTFVKHPNDSLRIFDTLIWYEAVHFDFE